MSLPVTNLERWKKRISQKKNIIKNLDGFLLSITKKNIVDSGIIFRIRNRLLNCVSPRNSYYQCSKDSNHKFNTVKFRCKSRGCPVCDPIYSVKLGEKFSPILDQQSDLRFLTLTIPNVQVLTRSLIRNILKNFSLCYRNLKEELVLKGAISKLEITYNSDPSSVSYNTWHPHLHILLSTDRHFTPDSKIEVLFKHQWQLHFPEAQQVKCIKADQSSFKEILKYSLKPSIDVPFAEYFLAVSKIRLLRTYGCFRNVPLIDDSTEHVLLETEGDVPEAKSTYLGIDNHVPFVAEIPLRKRNIFTTTEILERDCPCCQGIIELYNYISNTNLGVKIEKFIQALEDS